jgi:FtsZ-interacting cell division protein YlmF
MARKEAGWVLGIVWSVSLPGSASAWTTMTTTKAKGKKTVATARTLTRTELTTTSRAPRSGASGGQSVPRPSAPPSETCSAARAQQNQPHLRAVPDQRPTRVSVLEPSSFNDAQSLADRFKRQQPVILNLQNVDGDLARRMVDFCAGLTYALDGQIQTVASRVFLLTPRNVEVSAEERKRIAERAFFNQL